MMAPRTPRKKRAPLTKISLPWIGIIIGIILINLLVRHYFFDTKKVDKGPQLKEQAIQQAQQAVRKKLGDSLSVSFPKKIEIQVKDSARYWVGGNVVTTSKSERDRQRPWMVTLKYHQDADEEAKKWEIVSCDIGE